MDARIHDYGADEREPDVARLILIVEDDARTARRLAQMLREEGYEVDLALDGAAAIARLSHEPMPDVLVTDVNLPRVDGLTVARYGRSRRSSLPVVVITGYPHLLATARQPIEPAPTVLTKPIDYGELVGALSRLAPPAEP
jgi:two-component system response regulator MprA